MKSLHFETPQHKALECETFVSSMQNLKQKEDLDGTKRPTYPKLLFVEAKTFMKATKKGDAFLIYVFPSPNFEPCAHEIPSQYHEFKDVCEKKNVKILSKHQLYNYTIDLHEERMQPPFGPIYSFSQDKLVAFREYIDEIFKKGFIQQSKSVIGALILFVKKKDGSLCMCVNYRGLN